jgi:hypothetical protein
MFKILISIVVLLGSCLFSTCQAQCFTSYELNVDYKGDDLFAQPFFLSSVDSCCVLCYNYTNCRAWTFVPDVQACWLKSSTILLRLLSNGRLSGRKPDFITSTPFTSISTSSPSLTTPTTTISTTTPTTTTSTTTTTPTTTTTTSTTPASTSLSTLTTLTTSKGYGCFIEYGINYFGNDFSQSFVASASDCCNMCGQTATCVVWSFINDAKYCFLKNALPAINMRQNYTGIISGILTLFK